MAITATQYELLKSLPVQRGSSLLEIGQANWYGDLDPQEAGLQRQESLFAIAAEFYATWFSPTKHIAIDKHGPTASKADLNKQIDTDQQYDVVINHGTAEHVFNIAQVFRTMHDACEVGGWLIHDAPWNGWPDHGFYNLQPTLFFDLARANCYEIAKMAVHDFNTRKIHAIERREDVTALIHSGELPPNANLFVALRKRFNTPFQIPTQGYYAGAISDAAVRAWEVER